MDCPLYGNCRNATQDVKMLSSGLASLLHVTFGGLISLCGNMLAVSRVRVTPEHLSVSEAVFANAVVSSELFHFQVPAGLFAGPVGSRS